MTLADGSFFGMTTPQCPIIHLHHVLCALVSLQETLLFCGTLENLLLFEQ